MRRFFNKLFNAIISIVVIVCLLTAGAYAGYALWDNQQIYDSVTSLQNELIAFKPEEDASPSFEELQAINPDVCAWLTMDGTRIDFLIQTDRNRLFHQASVSSLCRRIACSLSRCKR